MLAYYKSITDVTRKCIIYDNFMDDSKRYVITRWRLSYHKLYIETGRYKTLPVERKENVRYVISLKMNFMLSTTVLDSIVFDQNSLAF